MMVDWRGRFTAPTVEDLAWAPAAGSRLGVVTSESGRMDAWTWDLGTGERVIASTLGVGAEEVHVLPDGSGVVWWYDELGDERGHWMVTHFDGGEPRPLLPDVPEGWMMGLSLVPGAIALGLSTDDGYSVHLARGGEPARELYRSEHPAGLGQEYPQGGGGLSQDGALVCIRHAERGDILHQALRVLDARTGDPVGEQSDEGMFMAPSAWSPRAGDQRLAFVQERAGIERPAIWNLATGDRTDLELADREGPVVALGWTPDASALLLLHQSTGRQQVLRLDLASLTTETVVDVAGTITRAAFRPDGDLWLRMASSVDPPAIRDVAGKEVLGLGTAPPPPGRRFLPTAFPNAHGQTIHGFVVTPDGSGPFPTIVSVHGGPEWHHTDDYDPEVLAYADEGFAVVLVNYRGSTGYGRQHREAIKSNIGFPESEDVVAALDHAIDRGIADPARVFLEGWSWGGYLAMLNAGRNPDRWRAVAAGIPAGDYVAAHYECAPPLRAWDLAMLGGSPMDVPALYRERNPLTYVDAVRAPMLVIAGENDSRCPLGSVMVYAHALRVRGKPVAVHLYPGGHHANDVAERIRHIELIVEFFRRHL